MLSTRSASFVDVREIPMTSPVAQFLSAFASPAPDPAMGDRLDLFGQFVGSWDLRVRDHRDDGTFSETPGEWHFCWALAGRSVADVWICPARTRAGHSSGKHGASLRFPDPANDQWRSIWVEPGLGVAYSFVARATVDGEIVLSDGLDDQCRRRWTFYDIESASLRWRNETSLDGNTWNLNQTFEATRV